MKAIRISVLNLKKKMQLVAKDFLPVTVIDRR